MTTAQSLAKQKWFCYDCDTGVPDGLWRYCSLNPCRGHRIRQDQLAIARALAWWDGSSLNPVPFEDRDPLDRHDYLRHAAQYLWARTPHD